MIFREQHLAKCCWYSPYMCESKGELIYLLFSEYLLSKYYIGGNILAAN